MINMWSITHNPTIWAEPERFSPERFMVVDGGEDVDVRGGDMRLAPFGVGRQVCPRKNLDLATVDLWVGRLVKQFEWTQFKGAPMVLDKVLKLSCEMKSPLVVVAVPRIKSVSI